MQLKRFLTSLPTAILAVTALLVSTAGSVQAQGLETISEADWLATLSGTPEAALDSLIEIDSFTACLELDPADGQLEGFFIFGNPPLTITLFDGDEAVEILNPPLVTGVGILGEISGVGFFGRPFGWTNADGINVTKIQFDEPVVFDFPVLGRLDVSFFPGTAPPPPAETCFDQLEDVKAATEALLATATDADAYRLQSAFDCICWIQNDAFWVQPSGDRLTSYGSNVFLGGAYTIAFLEHVSDPQADVIIDQLLDVLECLVDREIEYAIENGGRQANIDKAMDFADLGDIIDEEFENEVVASLAYRLAWLNAFYSTY